MNQFQKPNLELDCKNDFVVVDGGILLGASGLTGRYWLGSLWYYANPDVAPDVEKCTAGVQLEAGFKEAVWLDGTKVLVGLDTGMMEWAGIQLTVNMHCMYVCMCWGFVKSVIRLLTP